MTPEHMDHFRQILSQSLEILLTQAGQTLSELVRDQNREIEEIDRASAYTDQAMKLRFRSRESRLIAKLLKALERIETNTYGICESCGEEIAIPRLRARPVTTKCIVCKEEEERLELMAR